jgi:3-oxoacyl-[acyl-carrier protein] reductase
VTGDRFAARFVRTAVDSSGGLDIMVNSVGYTRETVTRKMTDEQ